MFQSNFKIKRNKNIIEPEEILLEERNDKENSYGRLEWTIKPTYLKTVFWLSLAFFLIIFGRVLYLEAVKGNLYAQRAENNRLRYYFVNAPRGIIYDRYNEPLVENIPSYSLVMVPPDLPQDENSKDKIVQEVSNIFSLPPEEINRHLTNKDISLEPVLLKTNLSIEEVRKFETTVINASGFKIVQDNSRYYPYAEAMAHLVGYVGKMSAEDIKKYPNYPLTSVVGKTGLESYYEKYLAGYFGKKLIEVDASYKIVKDLGAQEPTPGSDLITTIDKDLQVELYKTLKKYSDNLGLKGAAGIALNPLNGEVLALVSLPSFDPNILTKGSPSKIIESYLTSQNYPLFNRAISGLYHPGSTIKPLMAVAALEEQIIDPEKEIYDEGEIVIVSPYDPNQKYVYRDWKKHDWVDLKKAIAQSCNVYFWTVGGGYKDIKGLGIEKIKKYWLEFNLDKKFNIDLGGETAGVLPDPEWIKTNRVNDPTWKIGDTYNVSIGEGNLLLTPLQILSYLSSIANGGKLMKPMIVKNIISSSNENVLVQESKVIKSINASAETLKLVQEGLREVILSGTAQSLKYLPIEVAGKSGSPKFLIGGKEGYHAMFVSYAPYDNPDIALIVLIEQPPPNTGSATTLAITEEILKWYYENKKL
ncbi:MAG TPA: penicillin-binding protein 2 [Candidatus Paceibacterota bacterium]|nr:penicillin-binding protein 2 [Candidatus Paceibacterota bacterium]